MQSLMGHTNMTNNQEYHIQNTMTLQYSQRVQQRKAAVHAKRDAGKAHVAA